MTTPIRSEAPLRIDDLRELTSDNPNQQRPDRHGASNGPSPRSSKELDRTIDLRRKIRGSEDSRPSTCRKRRGWKRR